MSKGIDYSKFDHIGDTSSDEESEPNARNAAPPLRAETPSPSASLGALQELQSLLSKCMKEGNVHSIMAKDILSASALLSAVTPDGIEERRVAAANNKELVEDPVHANLWNLTMKIRDDSKHVDELLRVNVIDRVISVIEQCDPAKYNSRHFIHDVHARLKLGGPLSTYEQIVVKRLCSDIMDICFSISVLHEMCRYRSGCVALAEHKRCLALLLNGIPFEKMALFGASLQAKFNVAFLSSAQVSGSVKNDWGNPMKYNFGMIEQGTIDTFGRLLNGLDKHVSLHRAVGELILTHIDAFEARLEFILLTYCNKDFMPQPEVGHCIKIKHSLSKLRTLLSTLDSNPKAWRSTFRIDRHLVPLESSADDDKSGSFPEKQKCRVCAKLLGKPKTCSRCKSVFYCSPECQKKDWRVHKKNCVKHRDEVPIDSEWKGGHYKQILRQVAAEIDEKTGK